MSEYYHQLEVNVGCQYNFKFFKNHNVIFELTFLLIVSLQKYFI